MTDPDGDIADAGDASSASRLGSLPSRRDHRRAFDQAQREADALFAQYQLSQLIASGGSPSELAEAVLVELVRLSGAGAGAIWLGRGRPRPASPARCDAATSTIRRPSASPTSRPAAALAASRPDLQLVVLGEEPPATLVALAASPAGGELDADGLRVAQLARHELAVAFGGARLREALERERHELSAIVDGATDVIVQVDEERRIVRLNPAGERTLGDRRRSAIAGRTCGDVLGCAAAGGHGEDACPLAEVIATGLPIGYRESAIRRPAAGPLRSPAAIRARRRTRRRRPGDRDPARHDRASARSSSSARASSRRSATSCGRRSRSSAATPRPSSSSSSTRPSSATTSSGSTR